MPQARFSRANLALVGVMVLALCLSTLPGAQKIALCVSADGHQDLKLLSQSCHGCSTSPCQRDQEPAAAPDADQPAGASCCVDLPLMFDLVGWLAPRGVEAEADLLPFASATPTGPVPAAAPAALAAGGTVSPPAPPRPAVALTALATVVLIR